jgi:hypothetical protein
MNRFVGTAASLLACAAVYLFAPVSSQAQEVVSVRRVQVLGKQNPVEIEIEASDRLVPQAQILTDPDRLVVDFANAVPSAQLQNQKLHQGEVKSVRVGLFSSKPPVTRVVLDLDGPQAYQIFPSGRTVIIKVGSPGAQAARVSPVSSSPSGARLVNAGYSIQSVQITPPPPTPPLVVLFQSGLLTIRSNKASLSEVLFAVHERTGAEIAIPAGAEQEKVVAEIGPAPAPEVLSRLLNGSRFNFLILSSASNPGSLDRVILTTRPDSPAPAYSPQAPVRNQPEDEAEAETPSREAPPSPTPTRNPGVPNTGTPPGNDVPD